MEEYRGHFSSEVIAAMELLLDVGKVENKQKGLRDEAARAARIKERNEDVERSAIGRALGDSSDDESALKATVKTTAKATSS